MKLVAKTQFVCFHQKVNFPRVHYTITTTIVECPITPPPHHHHHHHHHHPEHSAMVVNILRHTGKTLHTPLYHTLCMKSVRRKLCCTLYIMLYTIYYVVHYILCCTLYIMLYTIYYVVHYIIIIIIIPRWPWPIRMILYQMV